MKSVLIRVRSLPSVGAYLLVCRGWLNNKKGCLIKGKSAKIAAAFIQNKANFKNIKISVISFETSKYEILPAWRGEKTNPIQTQTKPIQTQFLQRLKMNTSIYYTKVYNNETALRRRQYKPNSNPIQSQFQRNKMKCKIHTIPRSLPPILAHLLFCRGQYTIRNRYCETTRRAGRKIVAISIRFLYYKASSV